MYPKAVVQASIIIAAAAFNAVGQQTVDEIKALRSEVESLQISQRLLQRDLQLIKNMLLGKQVTPEAPPLNDVVIETAGAASRGSSQAKVVLVEFSDYQCPFCGRYANDTFSKIEKEYVNTGKVQYVFRNFPLSQAHPFAQKAAEAAECAGEQGKYWEAHERLFRNQALDARPLVNEAASLGMDAPAFRTCLDSGQSALKVKADLAEGLKIGVEATPTFFFGYRDETDRTTVHALKMLTGAQPVISFSPDTGILARPTTERRRSPMNRRSIPKLLLTILLLSAAAPELLAGIITLDFEGFSDSTFITTQYTDLTFANAVILTSGISLNEIDFPPRSGVNVLSDSGGPISIVSANPVQDFLAYFVYTVPVTLQGFDGSNKLLASAVSMFSNNTATGGDTNSNPNELLEISSATGFSKIVITGDPAGSSFTLDDAAITAGQVPEPSFLVLSGFAVFLIARKSTGRL